MRLFGIKFSTQFVPTLMLVQLKIPFAGKTRVLVRGMDAVLDMVMGPYEPSLPVSNAKLDIGFVAKLPSSRAITFAFLFFIRLFFIGLVVVLWIIWKWLWPPEGWQRKYRPS